jgi:hypothetical protein
MNEKQKRKTREKEIIIIIIYDVLEITTLRVL